MLATDNPLFRIQLQKKFSLEYYLTQHLLQQIDTFPSEARFPIPLLNQESCPTLSVQYQMMFRLQAVINLATFLFPLPIARHSRWVTRQNAATTHELQYSCDTGDLVRHTAGCLAGRLDGKNRACPPAQSEKVQQEKVAAPL